MKNRRLQERIRQLLQIFPLNRLDAIVDQSLIGKIYGKPQLVFGKVQIDSTSMNTRITTTVQILHKEHGNLVYSPLIFLDFLLEQNGMTNLHCGYVNERQSRQAHLAKNYLRGIKPINLLYTIIFCCKSIPTT